MGRDPEKTRALSRYTAFSGNEWTSSALDFEGQRIDGVGRIGIRIFNSLTVGCSGNHPFNYTWMASGWLYQPA